MKSVLNQLNQALLFFCLSLFVYMLIVNQGYGQCVILHATGPWEYNDPYDYGVCWNTIIGGSGGNTSYYGTINVIQGYTYEFTTCPDYWPNHPYRSPDNHHNPRNSTNLFDTHLVLRKDTDNSLIAENNDDGTCSVSTASSITWQATFTGKVRAYVHKFPNLPTPSGQFQINFRIKAFPSNVKPNYIADGGIVSLENENIDANQNLKIETTITNIGNSSNTASKASVYLSIDQHFDSGDTHISDISIPPLGVGDFYHQVNPVFFSQSLVASLGIVPGTSKSYHLILKADNANQIAESNEMDNAEAITWKKLNIHMPLVVGSPDYVPQLGTIGFHHANHLLDFPWNIKNIGTGDVAGMDIQSHVYFSYDATISDNDHEIFRYYTLPLKIGEQKNYHNTINWFNFTTPGSSGYIIIKTDYFDDLTEANKINNTKVIPITFPQSLPLIPDLRPLEWANYIEGQVAASFFYTAYVINESDVETPSPVLAMLYYSQDDMLDEEDMILTEIPIDPLGPGAEVPLEMEVWLPEEIETGPAFLLLELDTYNEIEELDEENNLLVSEIMIHGNVGPQERRTNQKLEMPELEMKVYPNPSTDQFHFTIDNQSKQAINNIQVLNHLGQVVYQANIQADLQHTFNLADQPDGIYILKLHGTNYQESRKLVLRR